MRSVSAVCDLFIPYVFLHCSDDKPYFIASPPALLVSSQVTRSAGSNAEAAVKSVHQAILSAAKAPIIGETSQEQRARVKNLAQAEKAKRRVIKDKQKATKASRRGEW